MNELHAPQSPVAARFRRSPNFGQRRGPGFDAAGIDTVMLHYTGMSNGLAVLDWLCNPDAIVSAHYVVRREGEVVQLVDEALRAHHAGEGRWCGDPDLNSRSIGIEIQNEGHSALRHGAAVLPPFPDAQMEAVVALCSDLARRHSIAPWRVIGHSDHAPGRKADPGEAFDWARLAEAGTALWVEPAPVRAGTFFQEGETGEPVAALQALLAAVGYDVEPHGRFDRRTRAVVEAFQRRHRPERVDGIADPSTIETLARWARVLPSKALTLS